MVTGCGLRGRDEQRVQSAGVGQVISIRGSLLGDGNLLRVQEQRAMGGRGQVTIDVVCQERKE